MKHRYLYMVIILFPLILTAGGADAESNLKPLSYSDIFSLEEVYEPRFSPDGQKIVYMRVFADIDTDRKYSNLYIVDLDGRKHRALTQGNFYDRRPRWSPDGKRVLFSSNRGKGEQTSQLFALDVNAKELTQLTMRASAPRAHAWSPDGKYISYVAFVEESPSSLVDLSAPPGENWAKPPIFIDKLHYRYSGQYLPNGEDHLFVISGSGGTSRQITPPGNHYSLSPHKETSLAWSVDGRSLIFDANLHPDREFQPLESNLYEVIIDKGELIPLVQASGPQHSPVLSPDGKTVAYLGYEGSDYKQVTQIYVIEKGDRKPRLLSQKLDRSARQLQWSADGQGVFFLYDDAGITKLGYISLQGKYREVAKNIGSASHAYPTGNYDISTQGNVVFTQSLPGNVGELRLVEDGIISKSQLANKNAHRSRTLISVNRDVLDQRALGKVEEISYPSSVDGLQIQGWVVKPPHFDPNQKYPLIVNLHGGPMDNFGNRFSFMMQLMAAQGYIVLYTNPRGSSSYGESFADIIHQQAYPGNDFYDVNSGVDALLQRSYIDKDNLFITGISYGATLTCWAIGKTNRFRAAVPLAPVTNWYSATLTTEAPVLYQQLSGGLPWEDQASYLKRSPLSLVGQVTTPTLLITGDADYRNPISETEAYYTALKLQQVEAAMLRLPGEDHTFYRRPSNILQVMAHMMGWFDQRRVDNIVKEQERL